MLFIGSRSIASGAIYVLLEALTYSGANSLSNYTTIGSNCGSLSSGNPIGGAKSISLLQ
jgi:hypothetical protein